MKEQTYIIRIDRQSDTVQGAIVWEGGVGHCSNSLSKEDIIKDLQANGLTIAQFAYSTFGQCYFFEVSGKYTGGIEIVLLKTTSEAFSWDV